MKRTDALAPLSREHHVALELALRLRRADEQSAPTARMELAQFLAGEGGDHFAAEEEILLPAVADLIPAGDPDVARVLTEHAELRQRAADLANEPDAPLEDVHAAGELLASHIRHEERVLFPRIEEALDESRLAALATALREAESGHRPPRL